MILFRVLIVMFYLLVYLYSAKLITDSKEILTELNVLLVIIFRMTSSEIDKIMKDL